MPPTMQHFVLHIYIAFILQNNTYLLYIDLIFTTLSLDLIPLFMPHLTYIFGLMV